jgi:uncharacterized UPF0160 family protein
MQKFIDRLKGTIGQTKITKYKEENRDINFSQICYAFNHNKKTSVQFVDNQSHLQEIELSTEEEKVYKQCTSEIERIDNGKHPVVKIAEMFSSIPSDFKRVYEMRYMNSEESTEYKLLMIEWLHFCAELVAKTN